MSDERRAWIDWLAASVARLLDSAPPEVRSDIIVVQLLLDEAADHPDVVTHVAWNTERHLREQQPTADNPVERGSMEWNSYAYAQPPTLRIPDDGEGAACRERFLASVDLSRSDDEEGTLWDAHLDALVDAANRLHAGVLERLIGRDVPVLIHVHDHFGSPEGLRELNRRANPPQFHERLVRWSIESKTAA